MRSEVFEFLGSDEATSHIDLRIIWSVKNEAGRKLDMLNRVKWAIWIHRKQDRKVNGYREKPDSRISSRTFSELYDGTTELEGRFRGRISDFKIF